MTQSDTTGLTQLGANTELPKNPEEAVLERVRNSQGDTNFVCGSLNPNSHHFAQ